MSERPAQPDSSDSPEQTTDLQAQVDLLLAQIERQAPEAVPEDYRTSAPAAAVDDAPEADAASDVVSGTPSEAASEAVPEAVPEAASEPEGAGVAQPADPDAPSPASSESLEQDVAAGDALAEQIQQLLDQAQAEAEGLADETRDEGESAIGEGNSPSNADAGSPERAPVAEGEAGTVGGAGRSDGPDAPGDVDEAAPAQAPQASVGTQASEPSESSVAPTGSDASAAPGATSSDTPDTPAAPGASADAAPDLAAGDDEAPSGDFRAPEAVLSEAGEAEPSAEGEGLDADPTLITRIDQMLADEAEDALSSGEFESVSDLLGSDADADADANAAATGNVAATATPEGDAAPRDRSADALDPTPTSGATAADVARELDEQPESAESTSTAPAAQATERAPGSEPTGATPGDDKAADTAEATQGVKAPDAAASDIKPPRTRSRRRHLALLAAGMRRACGLVNAPLHRLSPQVRSTIGWVGVMTLFNALCLIIVGLIR